MTASKRMDKRKRARLINSLPNDLRSIVKIFEEEMYDAFNQANFDFRFGVIQEEQLDNFTELLFNTPFVGKH